MLQRIAPQSTTQAHALPLFLDDEESFTQANATQPNRSLYTLALALRVGFLAALLLKAFAIWQW